MKGKVALIKQNLTNQKALSGTKNNWLLVIKMSLPVILLTIAGGSYVLIDAILSANLIAQSGVYKSIFPNSNPVSTMFALIGPIWTLLYATSVIPSVGTNIRYTKLLNKNNPSEMKNTLGTGFWLSIIIAAITMFLGIFITEPIMRLQVSNSGNNYSPEQINFIISESSTYLFIMLPALFLFNLNDYVVRTLRSENFVKLTSIIAFIGLPINIGIDYLTMSPNIGRMGIVGSAIATVSSVIFTFTLLMITVAIIRKRRKTNLFFDAETFKFKFKQTKKIFSLGLITFFRRLAQAVILLIIVNVFGQLNFGGEDYIPAAGVFTRIFTINILAVLGLVQGAGPIISYNYGHKNYKAVIEVLKITIIYSIVISLIMSAVEIPLVPHIMKLFDVTPTQNNVFLLRIMFSSMFFIPFQLCAFMYFAFMEKRLKAFAMAGARMVILVPLFYIFLAAFPKNIIAFSSVFLIGDFIVSVLGISLVLFDLRKLNLTNNKIIKKNL